ncbi:outer membrane beta-barrel protein [Polaribacter sargassicola]|uniref:outer membrane beta-barrel protein n=1 Tax=Polaribacter sargassicola TaxID=2836891 RepID=UPI001F4396D1|nr:outer membrane beta-barrel protein [Polaribacter sp. DS7-9]MCG1036826.1 outer membrane beta-barrel protein [Polaribacter sp. DS7-9]
MKQLITVLTVILFSTVTFGQLQVSASTGYAIGSAGMKLGEKINTTSTENTYGSYGEGLNFQLRGTYFFNNKLGADLAFGYLNGADQTISEVTLPTTEVNAIARARAYGASLAVVYKFTDNVYGRFGALIKVGGKTEAVVASKSVFSDDEATALGLDSGSYTETNYVEDFHGHLPLGFVAALGYTFNLDDHFSLFVEGEYYGISLKRKDSELKSFNTDVFTSNGTLAVSGLYTLDNLPEGYVKNTTYVDDLSHADAATDASKELSQKVPYSSFGINFGIIYKFKG